MGNKVRDVKHNGLSGAVLCVPPCLTFPHISLLLLVIYGKIPIISDLKNSSNLNECSLRRNGSFD